jgi:hypothetical protein
MFNFGASPTVTHSVQKYHENPEPILNRTLWESKKLARNPSRTAVMMLVWSKIFIY